MLSKGFDRICRSGLYLVAATAFLYGCSDDKQASSKPSQATKQTVETQKTESKAENQQEFLTAPKPPLSFEQVQDTPAGTLSGKSFQENAENNKKLLDQFPPLKEQSTQAELEAHWAKLVSLYAESYPNPINLLIQNAYGDPNNPDSRFHLKQNYNIEIILDASGSMAAKIGNQTKMEIAKKAIQDFVGSLPKEAKVGLRVYGHKGSSKDEDKEFSCSCSEIVYPMQASNPAQLTQSLNQFQASGWTPIAKSLEEAAKDLAQYDEKDNTNIIFLVSDGVETCDGDPVAVAQKLKGSAAKPLINVIGFNVDAQGQQQLKQVAAALDGIYANVNNAAEMKEQFNQAGEHAKRWADYIQSSNQQAYDIKSKNYKDLNDWRFKTKAVNEREAANLRAAVQYLREKGLKIEQQTFLLQKVQERQTMIVEGANSLWTKLLDQNQQNYMKMIEDNAKKFKANTNY